MLTHKELYTTKRVRSGFYIVQGQGSQVLVWHLAKPGSPVRVFPNGFATTISVVGVSHREATVFAGTVTGEVLVWQIDPSEALLENRHTLLAPIIGISYSPGGRYLAALNSDFAVQVWKINTRQCVDVLPGTHTRRLDWSIDGSDLLIDGIVRWSESIT